MSLISSQTELTLLGYLDHCRQRYRGIFLVDCSDETSKEKSFNDIFSSINRDQRSFPTVKQKIKFVQWMLAKWSEPYLMVFHQGSENPAGDSLAQYFPPGEREKPSLSLLYRRHICPGETDED